MEELMRKLIRERILELLSDEEKEKAKDMSFEELVDLFYLYKTYVDILDEKLKNDKKGDDDKDDE